MKIRLKKSFVSILILIAAFLLNPLITQSAEQSEESGFKPSGMYGVDKVNPDGTYTMEIYGSPINYLDDGEWKPINTAVTKIGDVYGVEAGIYKAYFHDDHVEVVMDSGTTEIYFLGTSDTSHGETTLDIDENRATYRNGVDVEYVYTESGLKQNVILRERPEIDDNYYYTMSKVVFDQAVSAYVGGERMPSSFTTNKSVTFKNEKDETIFQLPAPVAYELNNTENLITVAYQVQVLLNAAFISVRTPYSWLSDEGRDFPVVIDPTTTIQPAQEDTYLYTHTPDTPAGSIATIKTRGYSSSSYKMRSPIKFDIAGNIPSGSIITSVKLYLYYSRYLYDLQDATIDIHKIQQSPARDWVESEATWNVYKTGSSWTSAGGDYSGTVSASKVIPYSPYGWIEWTSDQLKADVQNFLDYPSTNYGWILKDSNENTGYNTFREFKSSNYAIDESLRPKLEVTYSRLVGSGFNFLTNQIDVTPGSAGSWQDVDVSGDGVPAGATGVILRLVNTDGTTARMIAVRKNGSEDDFRACSKVAPVNSYIGAWIGIDSNRIFEAYIETNACKVYLIGYTDSAVTFFDNAVDKTPGTSDSWQLVDCSSDIPSGATGVILETFSEANALKCGVRKTLVSGGDDYKGVLEAYHHAYFAIGVNSSRQFDAYMGGYWVRFKLIGYTKSPVTFFDNVIDKTPGSTGSWLDIDLTSDTSSEANGAIWLPYHGYLSDCYISVRKDGSTDPEYRLAGATDATGEGASAMMGISCGLDPNQVCEGYVQYRTPTVMNLFLIGYCYYEPSTISADADSFMNGITEDYYDDNHGACETINVYDYEVMDHPLKHGIIRFDLSEIPEGNKVARARLYLYVSAATSYFDYPTIGAHRVTNHEADWTEGAGSCSWPTGSTNDVTWENYTTGSAWTSLGGDFNSTATDSKYIDEIGWYYWDVTADCDERAMRSWILKQAVKNDGMNCQFRSKEYADSDYHPYLEVIYSPTAIDLLSFTATGDGNKVKVEWETAQEIDNMGFYLYRGKSPGGPFIRLTNRLIPGLTFSVRGKSYTYEDTNVTPGELYYYKLEDIDIHGKHTFHGPICVDWDQDGMPDDWEIAYGLNPTFNDSGIDSDEDGLTNLEEYEHGTDPFNPDTDGDGIPDGEDRKKDGDTGIVARVLTPGVEVISSDDTGITLELHTDAFDMDIVEAQGVAYERLRILDYIHGFTKEVGSPELPIKGIFLDLPEGKSATLKVEHTDTKTYSGYWIYPVPENTLQGEGGMDHVGEVFSIDEAAYSTDAFYPDLVAQLGKTYIFRDQQKLQVLFYPLAFNPVTGELMHYTRIRVRVTYEDTSESLLMGNFLTGAIGEPSGPGALTWAPPSENPAYKISVSSEGIYHLTRGYLEDNGVDVDSILLSQVRLYNLGEEIAIHVYDQNLNNSLDTGDYIEFYGKPVEAGYAKYARYNIYWLTTSGGSGAPKRMAAINGTPGSTEPATSHTYTVHHEQDEEYWLGAPGGDSLDRWFFPFDHRLLGQDYEGGAVDFPITLSDVAAGPASLVISIYGAADIDHRVDVWVNTAPVGSYTWSGIAAYQATISPVALQEGENTVTMECMSGLDVIYVDVISVTYPRGFTATGDELAFSHDEGYRYQISGFSVSDLLAFDITSPGDVAQIDFPASTEGPPYTLDFEPQSGGGERTYLVLSSDRVKTPSGISEDTPSTLCDAANGADYILITHRDLGWDGNGNLNPWLSDLVAFRQSQGLRVTVVDVEDIFDEFSYGITTPQAIKDFLTHAYTNWATPAPQYVLLLGAGTYDYKNNWNLDESESKYVPSYLTFTNYLGETATDEWFVRVSGDDAIPDLYIGRLPAASVDQASVMVNKIITYETGANTKTWEKNTLLLADNQTEDYEAVFETMNEDVASLIPTGLNAPFKEYLNDYLAPGDLTADIKEKINNGTLVVNYAGHASIQIWARENIFDNTDVADLTNNDMLPFFVSMSCLSGYFGYPDAWDFPSLAEALVRSEGRGAVAAFMPTGMTTPDGQHILDTALFNAIFTDDTRTLGPAISLAKQTLLANGGSHYEEVAETFLLFGDPAMELKIPLPRRPLGFVAQLQAGGVALSWQEAKDCNGNPVAGYNLYRSTTPGGIYTRVNTSLITGTGYNDTSGETGTTYYYVVTSVDSDGDESVRSSEVGATPSAPQDGDVPSLPGLESSSGCFISSAAGWMSGEERPLGP